MHASIRTYVAPCVVCHQQLEDAIQNVRDMEYVGIFEYWEVSVCLLFFTFNMGPQFDHFCVEQEPAVSLADYVPKIIHVEPIPAPEDEGRARDLGMKCMMGSQEHACTSVSNGLDAMIYSEALEVGSVEQTVDGLNLGTVVCGLWLVVMLVDVFVFSGALFVCRFAWLVGRGGFAMD